MDSAKHSIEVWFERFHSPPAGIIAIILFLLALVILCLVHAIFITLLGVVEHLLELRRRQRPRPPPLPICPGCGYDLRASQFRCPECGREIALTLAPRPRVSIIRGFVIVSTRRGFVES